MYGYILGLQHKHSDLISRIIPSYFIQEDGTEMLTKTFYIKSNFNNEKVNIINSISFPHSWHFDEIKVDDDNNNKDILNAKKYVVSSPEENIKLIITPKSVNNLRSVMSTTIDTTLNVLSGDVVEKRCLGTYDVLESEQFEYISLYRENLNSNEIKYVQEVSSVANSQESNYISDEFLVFKRNGGFIPGKDFVWTADISLEFDESMIDAQKNEYLIIIDEIVSSLRIK